MKAARLYGPADLRIEEVPDPVASPGWVVVRVEACGVCPSDTRVYNGTRPTGSPWTPGHEIAGVVAATAGGASARDVVPPDTRVAVDWRSVCGVCYYCGRGEANFCERRREFAIAGFAELTRVPEDVLHPLDDSLSFSAASFCEPLACVLNAHRGLPPALGSDVVVIGAGPIGLLHLQVAVHRGARVIVTDFLPERLAVARRLGAFATIVVSDGDPVAAVKDLTRGRGANAVIVAVGSAAVAETAIAMACKGGAVNLFAGIHPPTTISLDPNLIHYNQVTLTGSHDYGPGEFATALRLLENGIVCVDPLVTGHYPLADIRLAYEATNSHQGLKSIVHPNGLSCSEEPK
jgi:L-iditol 2-dehydrogenase